MHLFLFCILVWYHCKQNFSIYLFLNGSLIVYRHCIDFCTLIFHLMAMLNSLPVLGAFTCKFFGIFYINNHVVCKQLSLVVSYLRVFCCFFMLIALSRTFSPMLKKMVSGNPCLCSTHRRKAFSFLPLSMTLDIGVSWVVFFRLRKLSSIFS